MVIVVFQKSLCARSFIKATARGWATGLDPFCGPFKHVYRHHTMIVFNDGIVMASLERLVDKLYIIYEYKFHI